MRIVVCMYRKEGRNWWRGGSKPSVCGQLFQQTGYFHILHLSICGNYFESSSSSLYLLFSGAQATEADMAERDD